MRGMAGSSDRVKTIVANGFAILPGGRLRKQFCVAGAIPTRFVCWITHWGAVQRCTLPFIVPKG
jgi:hypothetical protein